MGHFYMWGIFMRMYLILAAMTAVLMFCLYYAGFLNGHQKCQRIAAQNNIQMQSEIIKLREVVNAETVHRGTDDIRRRLYEAYTIAD
jgi:sensor domain CHASE-containing protein